MKDLRQANFGYDIPSSSCSGKRLKILFGAADVLIHLHGLRAT